MMYDYSFEGRKPSIKQVLKQISEGIRQNARVIYISWGENRIDLERLGYNQAWHGSGWIKGISGYDIAKDLNHKHENQTLNLWNS